MFGVTVQVAAVCHVVTCSLPDDPPKCHHETPESPSPETCKEFAAAAASISLDVTLVAKREFAPELHANLVSHDRAEFVAHSPPPTLTALRI